MYSPKLNLEVVLRYLFYKRIFFFWAAELKLGREKKFLNHGLFEVKTEKVKKLRQTAS